jgi:DNA-binding response OmpR family regulator
MPEKGQGKNQITPHVKRILLIEDDSQVRKLFNRKLSSEGYGIIEAADGKTSWSHKDVYKAG